MTADIAATPLEQFAAQLMTRYFIPEYLPASQIPTVVTINQITWDFLPDNSHRERAVRDRLRRILASDQSGWMAIDTSGRWWRGESATRLRSRRVA